MIRSMLLFGLLILPVAAGCGEGASGAGRAKTVPLTGKVTLDGKPFANSKIQLIPQGESEGARTSYAQTKEDGSFSATTYVTGDGVVPGKYIVKAGSDGDAASTDPAALMASAAGTAIDTAEIDVPADGLKDIELKLSSANKGKGAKNSMLGL